MAVAIQRACSPGPKRDLAEFLDGAVPRLSCLPSSVFTWPSAYHRVAQQESPMSNWSKPKIARAKAAVARFLELSTDVLAFDTTNFRHPHCDADARGLARRGHAKQTE